MTSSLLFNITTFAYLISMLCFFVHVASRNEQAGTAGSYSAYGGLLVQTVAILLRWKESYDLGMGHAPLSNLYESVVFLCLDHHPDLCLCRLQIPLPDHRRLCRPVCPVRHGLGAAGAEQRHRAAGAGAAEQLAHATTSSPVSSATPPLPWPAGSPSCTSLPPVPA